MTSTASNQILYKIFALVAIALVAACAPTNSTKPSASASSEVVSGGKETEASSVGERAVARWQHIVAGRYADAYNLLSPGYRQTISQVDYELAIRNRPLRWTDASYMDQSCTSEDLCTVKIMLNFEVQMPSVGVVKSQDVLEEKWIRSEGQWYFLPTTTQVNAASK